MVTDPQEIVKYLTTDHKQCILKLSSDWKSSGYPRVYADILYALGDSNLYGKLPELVDCRWHVPENQSGRYEHRLTQIGALVKEHLEEELV